MDANSLRPAVIDLFGEVPVTAREMRLWLWSVPVWFTRHSRPASAAAYLAGYRVAEKIARAKTERRLESIFGDECCPHCGATLESGQDAEIEALRAEVAELRALLNRPRAPVIPLRYTPTHSTEGEYHEGNHHDPDPCHAGRVRHRPQ